MKKLIYILSLLIFACGGKDEKSEAILKEAAKLHNEAVAVHDSLMPMMKKINELESQLSVKKDSLVGKNDSLANQVQAEIVNMEAISAEMKTWMESIVEVPGNEEHHHHEGDGHEHKHDHSEKVEVTPDQMLEIQKEMKVNILKIKEKVKNVLDKQAN
jgi:predicted glycoside hydrolase/deacetylase ChbG (UPF0249 family)